MLARPIRSGGAANRKTALSELTVIVELPIERAKGGRPELVLKIGTEH